MTSKNIINGVLSLGFLTASAATAAGLEQEVMWSGKNAGMASAVTSSVEGPEALYFNPAGLVYVTEDENVKNEMSFNFSYMRSKFKAPVNVANQTEDSKDGNDFAGSVMYSRQLSKDLAVGVGIFPSGGLAVDYKAFDLGGGFYGAPKADLKILEFSSGVAYRPISNLTFGLAYRITYSMADLTTVVPFDATNPFSPSVIEFKDLKGWDFFSFRGGVQYKEEKWGAGMSFRTPIIFKVKGSAEVSFPGPTSVSDDDASISTTFPLTVSLGGYIKPIEALTLLLDYEFLNYKATDDLAVTSDLGLPNQPLRWKDGHLVRLGAQYVISDLSLRAGYIFSTAITNKDTMTPTTEAPGPGHSFTVGSGYKFTDTLGADLALFYGFGKKDVSSTTALPGSYEISGFAAHTGLSWKF